MHEEEVQNKDVKLIIKENKMLRNEIQMLWKMMEQILPNKINEETNEESDESIKDKSLSMSKKIQDFANVQYQEEVNIL